MKADLENYITGHWGEDQFRDEDEECYECGGDGYIVADCFEDTCCCADPETSHGIIPCPVCTRKVTP